MWVHIDEEGRLVLTTAEGRVKAKLMHEGATVAVSMTWPDNPHFPLLIRGVVVKRTKEGADAVLEEFGEKYLGRRNVKGGERITVLVEPRWIRGDDR